VTDLRRTIAPKSDQLNADDLIGDTKTIKVTKVSLCTEADQPIAINYEGDNGKPYKPCKSMRRVLVQVWGHDGNTFTGRRMTLYRDDKVTFGGAAVGGIRISHVSHIDHDVTMALTATRANRRPFTVKPLSEETKIRTRGEWLSDLELEIAAALVSQFPKTAVEDILSSADVERAEKTFTNGPKARLTKIIQDAIAATQALPTAADDEDVKFPGDRP
jgi:hypothetical protein